MVKQKPKLSEDQSDWDKEIVAPITLKMKRGTWEVFKDCVPRSKTLNDKVVELIWAFCMEECEDCSPEETEQFMKEQKEYADAKKSKK